MKLGKKVGIEKIKSASGKEVLKDIIPAEILLTVFLNNIPLSTLSCSPVNVYELAIGFLVNNGYIKKYMRKLTGLGYKIKQLRISCQEI